MLTRHTHRQQEEAQGGIARSGTTSHLAHQAVAALDAEASAITGIDLLRCSVEVNDDKSQPIAASLAGLFGNQAGEKG